MTQAITEYEKCGEELYAAVQEFEKLMYVISDGVMKLKHWRNVYVSEHREWFPSTVTKHELLFSEKLWPTGEQICNALVEYHAARGRLDEAYRLVPERDRVNGGVGGRVEPPSFYEYTSKK